MLLKELTQTFGVSGYEEKIRDYIIKTILPYVDELKTDAMGNIIALKKGSGGNKRIMASAHMDEIGFTVTAVDDKGFLKVKSVGGISMHVSYMNRVIFENGTIGIISSISKIDEIKTNDIDKLYIDIGAKDKEDALKKVNVGDCASYYGEYTELQNNLVTSKALDDRIGCYIQIEALKQLDKPYHDTYFVFSVQEEVGLRGAETAAARINPDMGISLDVTTSFDVPDRTNGNVVVGKGAAIKMQDSSVFCDRELTKELIQCAEDNNIEYQLEVLPGGGTDAGAINLSNKGVKSIGISIGERYLHSPHGLLSMDDANACINLLKSFLERKVDFETEKTYK